ncbi:MAG: hypothetical protein WBX14_05085 [Candidatus Udaeobacter sp.]
MASAEPHKFKKETKMWFELILAAALMVLYVAFWAWHSQGAGKLTQAEIDQYVATIEKLPRPEKAVQAFIARLRPWAEADDGKPVYMFNLIRFFPRVQPFSSAPDFKGTPEQANARYEKSLIWLWLSHASYPTFMGTPQAKNLINIQPERTWGNMTVVRYPSRRTFLKLISHPTYALLAPYKFIALELDLVPVSKGTVVPDLRWLVGGGFVIVFLLVGWIRLALLG